MMKMYQGSILRSESEPQPGSMDTIPPAGSVLFKPEHATQHCFNQMLESQFTPCSRPSIGMNILAL